MIKESKDQIHIRQPKHSPFSNKNKNMTNQNLWDASKTVLGNI